MFNATRVSTRARLTRAQVEAVIDFCEVYRVSWGVDRDDRMTLTFDYARPEPYEVAREFRKKFHYLLPDNEQPPINIEARIASAM